MKALFLCFCIVAGSLALAHPVAGSDDHSVVGVVTRLEPAMMEVVTDSGDTRLVALEPDTKYMKWVLTKSWAQDPRTDIGFLRVGGRGHVTVRPGEPAGVAGEKMDACPP